MNVQIKPASESEISEILRFIKMLAVYEKLENEVYATPEKLLKTLFGPKSFAEAIFLKQDSVNVGFALFFHNYSTFLAQPGVYLEDLFVIPEARGRGYGKLILSYLAKLAIERECGRLEWSVLDWNKPALDFYAKIGAVPMQEWTVQRLTGDSLERLAKDNLI